jgi:hypothetical protein
MSKHEDELSAFIGEVKDATDAEMKKVAASLIAEGEAMLIWHETDEIILGLTAKGWKQALRLTSGDAS